MEINKLVRKIKKLRKSEKCSCLQWKIGAGCNVVRYNKAYNQGLEDIMETIKKEFE